MNIRAVSLVTTAMILIYMFVANLNLAGQANSNAAAKNLKNPTPANAQSVAAGKAVYQRACAVCHGAAGKGDGAIVKSLKPEATKPSNFTDGTWDHGSTDGEIFVVIRDGVGPKFEMKGQKGKITDQDMWHLVNYIRSLGPGK
jgi:mono/diheme cytochrome c family protein